MKFKILFLLLLPLVCFAGNPWPSHKQKLFLEDSKLYYIVLRKDHIGLYGHDEYCYLDIDIYGKALKNKSPQFVRPLIQAFFYEDYEEPLHLVLLDEEVNEIRRYELLKRNKNSWLKNADWENDIMTLKDFKKIRYFYISK